MELFCLSANGSPSHIVACPGGAGRGLWGGGGVVLKVMGGDDLFIYLLGIWPTGHGLGGRFCLLATFSFVKVVSELSTEHS